MTAQQPIKCSVCRQDTDPIHPQFLKDECENIVMDLCTNCCHRVLKYARDGYEASQQDNGKIVGIDFDFTTTRPTFTIRRQGD